MNRERVLAWIDLYEGLWRTPGTDRLGELFTDEVTYLPTPYWEPIAGLAALAEFWEGGRDGADEAFSMSREIVALDGDTAVARVDVVYGDPVTQVYADLWVLRFRDGRCVHFEEWPFWPTKGRSPGTTPTD